MAIKLKTLLVAVLAAGTVGLAHNGPGRSEPALDVTARGAGTLGVTDPTAMGPVQRENGSRVVTSPEIFGTLRRARPSPNRRIAVTLLSFDRDTFVWGDLFTFTVRIENVGKEPLQIPWSPDTSLVEAEGRGTEPDLFPAMIRLVVTADPVNAAGLEESLASLPVQSLAGSPHYPGTLHRLAPGERVQMKLYGRWSSAVAGDAAKVLQQPDGRVRVAAVVTVFGEGVSQKSSNALQATVLRQIR